MIRKAGQEDRGRGRGESEEGRGRGGRTRQTDRTIERQSQKRNEILLKTNQIGKARERER